MTRQKVTITLERKLIEKIDEDRGLIPRSRYIEKLLKETTENKPPQNPPRPGPSHPSLPRPVQPRPDPSHPDLTKP